jgi:hypothetical protein
MRAVERGWSGGALEGRAEVKIFPNQRSSEPKGGSPTFMAEPKTGASQS